jgi:hypothetical protein
VQLAYDLSLLRGNEASFEGGSRDAGFGTPGLVAASREVRLEVCEGMLDVVSALFNVSGRELRKSGRSSKPVGRIRQIAMYVTHCTLGLTMSDVGLGFGRDRTTVLHACHLIEDMRDDAEFDRVVTTVERVAMAAFGNRFGQSR